MPTVGEHEINMLRAAGRRGAGSAPEGRAQRRAT